MPEKFASQCLELLQQSTVQNPDVHVARSRNHLPKVHRLA